MVKHFPTMKTMRAGRQRIRSRSPFQRRRKAQELLTDVQRLEEEYYLAQLNRTRSLSPGQRIRRDELIAAMEEEENKPRSCLRAPFRFNRVSSAILFPTPVLQDVKDLDVDNNTQPTPSTAAHDDDESEGEGGGEAPGLVEREFSRVTSVATGAGDSPVEVVLAPPPPSKPSPKRQGEKEGEILKCGSADSKLLAAQSTTSTAGPTTPEHSTSKSPERQPQPQQQVLLQHHQEKPQPKRKTLRKLFMKSRSETFLNDQFSTPPRSGEEVRRLSRGRARVRDDGQGKPEQSQTPNSDPKPARSPRGIRIYPPIVTPGSGGKNRGAGRPSQPRIASRLEETTRVFDGIMEKEYKPKHRTPSSIQLHRKPSHVSEISTPAALLHSRVKSFGDDSVAEIRRALRQVESQLSTNNRGSLKDARELILHALSKVAASLESAEDRKLLNKQLRELQDTSLDSYESEVDSEYEDAFVESDLLMLCGPDGIMNNKTSAYRNRMKRNRDLKYHLSDDCVSESDRSVSEGTTSESSSGSLLNETRSFNEWFEELEGPHERPENKSIADMLGLTSFFSADEELDKEWSAFTNDRKVGYHSGFGGGIGQTFSSGFGSSFGMGDRVEDPLDSSRTEKKTLVEKEARHSDYSSHESSETSSGSTESSHRNRQEPIRGQRSWWKPASSDSNRGDVDSPKAVVSEHDEPASRTAPTDGAATPASPPSQDELSLSSIESDMYGKSGTSMVKVNAKEKWDSPYNSVYKTDESNAFLQFDKDEAEAHRQRQQWSPPRQRYNRRGLSPRNLWTRRGEQEEIGP